jgi:MoaA/NifB/PqqE/SkfB family radical SAM enzyme
LKNQHSIEKVTIGGGDPLSRPDIIRLLSGIKAQGLKINLDTVGTPLISNAEIIYCGQGIIPRLNICDIVDLVDVLGLPLDGSTNEIIQYFRKGRNNLMEEEIEILKLAEKNNINVSINTVVHKKNYHDLYNIFKIISQYKSVFRWQLFQYMPIGIMGHDHQNEFYITEEFFKDKISQLEKKIGNNSPIIINPKSTSRRKNIYLIIDNDGVAWCPKTYGNTNSWDLQKDSNSERVIWGNIRDTIMMPKLIEQAFLYQGNK